MDRISESAELSRMSHKKYHYGCKVKQMLTVFIRPLQYLCLILSGCCLLDICFDLPGRMSDIRCVLLWPGGRRVTMTV